jgi:prepilin-type processing-associated H-X9-DG protein
MVYSGLTGGYAYNRHLCNEPGWPKPVTGRRITDLASTSGTFMFSEVAQLESDGTLQEPGGGYFGSPFRANGALSSFAATATQFRFSGVSNVAFADGHVETRTPVQLSSVAPFAQATWDAARTKFSLGFLADTDTPYSGQ